MPAEKAATLPKSGAGPEGEATASIAAALLFFFFCHFLPKNRVSSPQTT
jgi:hypothetical protein